MKKAFILDTNVLLFDPLAIFKLGANDIIIPIVVIEEIDRFKREMSENGRHARQFTRLIDDMRKDGELSKGVKLRVRACSLLNLVVVICLFLPNWEWIRLIIKF